MVYSTCSILACENEEVVKKVLSSENAEIIPIDFLFSRVRNFMQTITNNEDKNRLTETINKLEQAVKNLYDTQIA